jgi:hypothetical protein
MISAQIHSILFYLLFFLPLNLSGQSQDVYRNFRESWLKKCERFKPDLNPVIIKPLQVVEIIEDASSYQKLTIKRVGGIDEYYQSPLKSKSNDLIIDFGGHTVGRIQFVIQPTLPAHAPVQLKFTFGEVPSELHKPFGDYEGNLSREGKLLLENMLSHEQVIKPVSPYLYHFVVDAMISCNMYQEARELLLEYWGGMIRKGADAFWEVYDPENDYLSPYGSIQMNSYCHAWSCTPVYFIRKYHTEMF